MLLFHPEVSARLSTLQSLDDAIAYRLDRLNRPCPRCDDQQACTEHRHDEGLIMCYQDKYAAAFRAALADTDPADIEVIMRPGDDIPPTTALYAAAILGHLRELAADGPVVTELDGGPVIIELDGRRIAEHPLTAPDDPASPQPGL